SPPCTRASNTSAGSAISSSGRAPRRSPSSSSTAEVTSAETVMARCDELAACSEEAERINRPFASPAMKTAQDLVGRWILQAGMNATRDNIGNVRGRYEAAAPGSPTLLMGSHLDTVRGAGRYDGMLGVLVAIECVDRLRAAGRALPFALEIVGFADEEGVRYGTAYLGSAVLAGRFDTAWGARTDAGRVT